MVYLICVDCGKDAIYKIQTSLIVDPRCEKCRARKKGQASRIRQRQKTLARNEAEVLNNIRKWRGNWKWKFRLRCQELSPEDDTLHLAIDAQARSMV